MPSHKFTSQVLESCDVLLVAALDLAQLVQCAGPTWIVTKVVDTKYSVQIAYKLVKQ